MIGAWATRAVWGVRVRLIVGVAVCTAAFAPGLAEGAFPGTNGRIAYVAALPGESDTELFTVLPDGSGVQRLTDDSVNEQEPLWSADGGRIAFVRPAAGRGSSVFTTNPDGTDVQFVAQGRTQHPNPSFTPSGRRIVYTEFTKLVSVRADGSGGRKVIASVRSVRDGGFTGPEVSPDGRWIVFSGIPERGAHPGIWKVRRDGTHFRRLTGNERDELPGFSPNGRRIIFARLYGGLTLMQANGKERHRLPNTGGFGYPAFSPAGDRIAMSDISRAAQCQDIYTMSSDGMALEQVTHFSGGPSGLCSPPGQTAIARSPAWQPVPD